MTLTDLFVCEDRGDEYVREGRKKLKTYEALFIFSSSLKDEALEEVVEQIRGEIAKLNGSIQGVHPMGKRTFVRPLKKCEAGQYVRIDFCVDPGNISALQARFKLNENIFRVQIVRGHEDRASKKATENPESGGK